MLLCNNAYKYILFNDNMNGDKRKELEKQVEEYNLRLESIAKPMKQLITSIEKKVKSIEFYGVANRTFTPFNERIIGARRPIYEIGDNYSCKITFQTEFDVKQVSFIGWPNIQAEDTLRAYIFAGEQKGRRYINEMKGEPYLCELSPENENNPPYGAFGLQRDKPSFYWISRPLKEHEEAIKLEKLKDYREVLATWISKNKLV
jgi:hypothetical protein